MSYAFRYPWWRTSKILNLEVLLADFPLGILIIKVQLSGFSKLICTVYDLGCWCIYFGLYCLGFLLEKDGDQWLDSFL
jgi:hypothetical protein